jgi:hypothetical protein
VGLVGGDTLTGLTQSYTSKNVLGANGSTLQVNGGYTFNDSNGGNNYTVTTNTASGTITPASLTVSTSSVNRCTTAPPTRWARHRDTAGHCLWRHAQWRHVRLCRARTQAPT